MGMAASQVRLLQLTSRKNDIGYQLQGLSLQKTALARDMQRVTKNYNEALSSKSLKWSNNAGVSYVDLSYNTLMQPGLVNQNQPYLLTNAEGRIVLDSKYEKYAEMISPKGSTGGDYQSHRTEILSSLIPGLTSEKLEASIAATEAVDASATNINTLQEEGDKLLAEKKRNFVDENIESQFWKKVGDITLNGSKLNDIREEKLGGEGSAKANLQSIIDQMKNALKDNWLSDEEYACFAEACDNCLENNLLPLIGNDEDNKDNLKTGGNGITGNKKEYKIKLATIKEMILSAYEDTIQMAGLNSVGENGRGQTVYYTTNYKSTSPSYSDWEARYNDWEKRMEAAKSEYKTSVDNNNQALDSETEAKIAFYDKVFAAIVDKGWTADPEVEDNNYLNNMLQNNSYYITTMNPMTDNSGKSYYGYSQDIASNFNNIFAVSDSDYIKEAESAYTYEKSIISEKESRIDTRMKNLETEQSAINNMIKGIEQVEKDNIDKNFNIFA